jgi:KDO2-lipid IV(A) lauroyltransferase
MAKSFIKKRKNDLVYFIILKVYLLAKFLPRKIGLSLFGLFGRVLFLLPTKDKKRTIKHLSLIFSGTWNTNKIMRTAREVYVNLGKNIFDAVYLSRCNNEKFSAIVKHNSLSGFQNASKLGKGVIGISSHQGCYEMNVQIVARNGFRCMTIGQKLFDKRVDRLIVEMRTREDIKYVYRDKSSREAVRFLKEGGVLGVLLDQDTYGDGVFAHFLGIPAYTLSGPIRLAMRYGIPVIAGYSARQKDDTHYIHFSEPIKLENTGDFNRDLTINVEKVNDFHCKGILKYPEQWVWMHRRWRRKPDNEKYKDVPNIEDYLH